MTHKTLALLIPALILSGMTFSTHARLYHWVDENGNVHYSDYVPPSQVRRGHTELSEGGIRIDIVPPAKTPEEVLKDAEYARRQAQQKELLKKQKSADLVLLRTFRSEDDIAMARDGKIADIDVMITVTKNKVRRQQEWLARQRAEAANLERTGKPIPSHLSTNIAQTERSIRDAYSNILDREAQKESIRASCERDVARFRQLKDLPEADIPVPAEDPPPVLHNIVACASTEECDRLWDRSTDYIRQNASTPIQTSGDDIFLTAPPAEDQDISLIVSRINDKDGPGASLFLDLQCKRSPQGEERCQSQQAQDIIRGFRGAITGEDGAQP